MGKRERSGGESGKFFEMQQKTTSLPFLGWNSDPCQSEAERQSERGELWQKSTQKIDCVQKHKGPQNVQLPNHQVGFEGHDDTWLAHQDDFQVILST